MLKYRCASRFVRIRRFNAKAFLKRTNEGLTRSFANTREHVRTASEIRIWIFFKLASPRSTFIRCYIESWSRGLSCIFDLVRVTKRHGRSVVARSTIRGKQARCIIGQNKSLRAIGEPAAHLIVRQSPFAILAITIALTSRYRLTVSPRAGRRC